MLHSSDVHTLSVVRENDARLADQCPASRSSAEGRKLTAVERVDPSLQLRSLSRLGVGPVSMRTVGPN